MWELIDQCATELSERIGITYQQAVEIITLSKCVNPDNYKEWIDDIVRCCKLDTSS